MYRYTITLGLKAGDPDNLWDRDADDYAVPADTVDYCRGVVRAYFPGGGRETAADGWWQQTTEPCLVFTALSDRLPASVVECCSTLAREAQQDCVLLEVNHPGGGFTAYLVSTGSRVTTLDGLVVEGWSS